MTYFKQAYAFSCIINVLFLLFCPNMATEQSVNPNLLCKPLVLLAALPTHDRNYLFSLLGHIELLRLSASCHMLRGSIRNNNELWKQLYEDKFLSGTKHNKEHDFILWCARTDSKASNLPTRRMDMFSNLDWYNTYRRRVTTENNWRHGHYKTAFIDYSEWNQRENDSYSCFEFYYSAAVGAILKKRNSNRDIPPDYYDLELSAHADLNGIMASIGIHLLKKDNEAQEFSSVVIGDHYITAKVAPNTESNENTVALFARGHGDKLDTIGIRKDDDIHEINGKWALLARTPPGRPYGPEEIYTNISVIDLDQSSKHSAFISGIWNTMCIYEANDESVIVYTARFNSDIDDCFEWALHQFSSTGPLFKLVPCLTRSHDMVMLEISDITDAIQHIFHSVASSDEAFIPEFKHDKFYESIPIPLLLERFRYPRGRKYDLLCDHSFSDEQAIKLSNLLRYNHIMGSLYYMETKENSKIIGRLVDADTQEIIRDHDLERPNGERHALFTGTITYGWVNKRDNYELANLELMLQEFGAL
ncbi:hypothetical protein BDF22DRAFT_695729 [Syncephalis plumigaleata]|nr:hypothetical protein BDF22DRAFT_695729 [Syncephalis plumigaleata]